MQLVQVRNVLFRTRKTIKIKTVFTKFDTFQRHQIDRQDCGKKMAKKSASKPIISHLDEPDQ